MLRVIIIEDEKPALQKLMQTLSEISSEVNVTSVISSVQEGVEYFASGKEADLIFSDVQLTDGLSFEIFRKTGVKLPIIFITGYNEYMINAFNYNGIDYLLKPVEKEDVEKAIAKYRMLKEHFLQNYSRFNQLIKLFNHRKRTRLLVKKGIEYLPLLLDDIVLFYTEDKIVYVIDRCGIKYLVDGNLSRLETELDERSFFRANRQYIININYVKGFKTFEKVKLQVDLKLSELNHTIIISQETAPEFRKWLNEV